METKEITEEMSNKALAMEMRITMKRIGLVVKEAEISKMAREGTVRGMQIVAIAKAKEDLESIQERMTSTVEVVLKRIETMVIDEMKAPEVKVDTLEEETREDTMEQEEEVEAVMEEITLDLKERMM